MPKIKLIAAIDNKLGIAKEGKIPWNLPSDVKYFRAHVERGPVLMGWNTYLSNNKQPFGSGQNTVLVDKKVNANNVNIIHDLDRFMSKNKQDIWIAGGGQVFASILPSATHLYLTRVSGDFDCDVFFPVFVDNFELTEQTQEFEENGIKFRFEVWQPIAKSS